MPGGSQKLINPYLRSGGNPSVSASSLRFVAFALSFRCLHGWRQRQTERGSAFDGAEPPEAIAVRPPKPSTPATAADEWIGGGGGDDGRGCIPGRDHVPRGRGGPHPPPRRGLLVSPLKVEAPCTLPILSIRLREHRYL